MSPCTEKLLKSVTFALLAEIDGVDVDIHEHIPEIFFKKLKSPTLEVDVHDQIECISGCISVGAARALKVQNRLALVICGNTGAGKSTVVNYVHGCRMEQIKLEFGENFMQVAKDSVVPELMPIGHSNQSTTFIPGIESDDNFTYIDCPGFLDNRGAEMNIVNAVNIKQAIHAAKGIAVVVVLNYLSLMADRGKGLKDLASIICGMFGNVERLAAHKDSIALGVSRVPISIDGEDFSLSIVKGMLEDLKGLTPSEADFVRELRGSAFIFDPRDRGKASLGWTSREELIALFRGLKPITDPSSVFQTALTKDDDRALQHIVEEMSKRVTIAIEQGNYEVVGGMLKQLQRIDLLVDNPFVTNIIGKAADCVRAPVTELRESAMKALLFGDLDEADKHLGALRAAVEGLRRWAPGYACVAEQALERVSAQVKHHRK